MEPTVHEAEPQLIEIGWVIAGDLMGQELTAIEAARDGMLTLLETRLPEFEWRMPMLQRRRLVQGSLSHPVNLLDAGAVEREVRHWDFSFVITDVELISYYTPYALGMPARSLGVAVISTAHLEPAMVAGAETPDYARLLAVRIEKLALHLLGHLNGLGHADEETSPMTELRVASDLDRIGAYTDRELEQLRSELREVADLRLEEEAGPMPDPISFHLQVAWRNRRDIWSTVRQIGPWRFPMRFSRLTIAAASTLVVLMMTAEAWDLGMTRPPGFVALFTLVSILASGFFVLKRQRLLVRRPSHRLSEQVVIANASLLTSVLMGMFTTWVLLFLLVLGASQLLFNDALVAAWATSLERSPHFGDYSLFAAFVATVGILIGALGASFEEGNYFRHVAYVDEET